MIKIREILRFLDENREGFSFKGSEEDEIIGFSSLPCYCKDTVTWCKKAESISQLGKSDDLYRLIIGPYGINDSGKCLNIIAVENPKKVFFMILENFFNHDTELTDIGKGTYISENVKIGKGVKIGYNCVIDGKVEIGDNTVIYNNVNIINKVDIGKNCVIHSGVNIGHDDYSYTEDEEHNKFMIKHYGGVKIEDDVFIGANSVINRGTIDITTIGRGSKIDAFCHVSHNVIMGEKNALISGTRLYGSVKTGENAYIASAMVKNQLEIGENAVVGMGSVVLNDVADDAVVAGVPAKVIKK